MIVDPDFADHWKTRMLVGLLGGDEAAPVYVLRIWAHCQNRRQAEFEGITPEALKALCRFPGHSNKLDASLAASGFIRREGNVLYVCNWSEYNASLIAAWANGRNGGRRKKPEPDGKKPTGEPMGLPTGSREEKRREELHPSDVNTPLPPNGGKRSRPSFVPPTVDEVRSYCEERHNGIDAQAFIDHYQAIGWVYGRDRKPIKDWKAAVRTWENNRRDGGTSWSGGGTGGDRESSARVARVRGGGLLAQLAAEDPRVVGGAGVGRTEMRSKGPGCVQDSRKGEGVADLPLGGDGRREDAIGGTPVPPVGGPDD